MKNTLSLKLFRTENIPNTFLFFSLFLLSNSHLHNRLPPSLHFLPLLDPRSFSPDPQTQRFSLWLCVFSNFGSSVGQSPYLPSLNCPARCSDAQPGIERLGFCTAAHPSLRQHVPAPPRWQPGHFWAARISWFCSLSLENVSPWELFPSQVTQWRNHHRVYGTAFAGFIWDALKPWKQTLSSSVLLGKV